MSDLNEEVFLDDIPAGEEDLMLEDELADLEFADNPEPRCPVLIIADCSGSMAGRPIDAMNQGIDALNQAIIDDEIARNRVEVALLSFNIDARVERDFCTVSERGKTSMTARGGTNMHLAIQQGCDLLEDRKEQYRLGGVPYFPANNGDFQRWVAHQSPLGYGAGQSAVGRHGGRQQADHLQGGGKRGGGAGDAEGVAQPQLQVPAPAAGQPAVRRLLRMAEQVGVGHIPQHARGHGQSATR